MAEDESSEVKPSDFTQQLFIDCILLDRIYITMPHLSFLFFYKLDLMKCNAEDYGKDETGYPLAYKSFSSIIEWQKMEEKYLPPRS